jgi:hypothetical protein
LEEDDPENGIIKFAALISHLLVRELFTRKDLLKFWGGAFEFVYFNGRAFRKINEIAYIINKGNIQADGLLELPAPIVAIYHKYYKDTLVVTSIIFNTMTYIDDGDFFILRAEKPNVQAYPIKTILQEYVPPSLETPKTFKTPRISMGYTTDCANGVNLAPFYYSGTENLMLSYNQLTNVAELRMLKDMNNMVVAVHQNAYTLFLNKNGHNIPTRPEELGKLIRHVSLD